MHVGRDLLDKQLVDRDEERLGRVDSVVLELVPDAPPMIVSLELGFVPLAHRIGRRVERIVDALHKRWSVRRSARYQIPWRSVIDVNIHCVKVDVRAEATPAFDWERWLRNRVIGRIPGAGDDDA